MPNHTEIHLVHTKTDRRFVVVSGQILGYSEDDVALDQTGLDRIRLRLTNSDEGIRIAYLSGDMPLVSGAERVSQEVVVPHGGTITLGEHVFRVEAYTTDYQNQPVVLYVGADSITGSAREHNEDAVGFAQYGNHYLMVIADGVGGAESGELVSAYVVQHLLKVFHDARDETAHDWSERLKEAVVDINHVVRQAIQEAGTAFRAGSTLTAVVVANWQAYVAHIGDSRLYHGGHTSLHQITRDQVVLHIDPTVKSHILQQAVGKTDRIVPDILTFSVRPGDKILMCSDGLTNALQDAELAALIEDDMPGQLARHLTQLADSRQSNDNISVLVAHVALGEGSASDFPGAGERIFTGYRPEWPVKLDFQDTSENMGRRRGARGRLWLWVAVLLGLIAITFAIGLRHEGGSLAGVSATATATVVPSATDTVTSSSTITDTATMTATPTQTQTPSPTLPPPTSTLRPTSTYTRVPPTVAATAEAVEADTATLPAEQPEVTVTAAEEVSD